jgi:hypothetical protein
MAASGLSLISCEDGLVIDAGFPGGIPLSEFAGLFPGWSIDDLVLVSAG